MVELQVPIRASNEGIRAARREIKAFLAYATDKQAGGRPDRHDTATLSYVVLRTFLELLDREVTRQDQAVARANKPTPQAEPTIRERRGR